jgi:hypothetical protein
MDISPLRTLKNCGSSSKRSLRGSVPLGPDGTGAALGIDPQSTDFIERERDAIHTDAHLTVQSKNASDGTQNEVVDVLVDHLAPAGPKLSRIDELRGTQLLGANRPADALVDSGCLFNDVATVAEVEELADGHSAAALMHSDDDPRGRGGDDDAAESVERPRSFRPRPRGARPVRR